jgi:integrase
VTSTDQRSQRVHDLSQSWTRWLRAQEKSPLTIRNYQRTIRLLVAWLEQHPTPGEGTNAADLGISADDLTDFVQDIRDSLSGRRGAANTTAHHYRNLRSFYSWMRKHHHITIDPMPFVARPKEGKVQRPALTKEEGAKLIRACSGRDFRQRRDLAIIRVLIDTGVRAGGLLGMTYADGFPELDNPGRSDVFLDHDPPLLRFRLKGGDTHFVDISPKTVLALDEYLRARRAHRNGDLANLWVTPYVGLTTSGLQGILDQAATRARIRHIHPHMFRRTMATWGLDGGQDRETVKKRGGWKSDAVMGLYVSESEQRRAWAESQRLRIADQV